MVQTVLQKFVRETNWSAVALAISVATGAIGFAFSIKSDIRDLGTQLAAYHADATSTDLKVEKLYDYFVGRSFAQRD